VSQIYAISAEGGEPKQVTKDATGGQVPYWSHNGKWIYYSAVRNETANIWKLSVDGGSVEPVTKNSGLYAAESFDGKYLYYSRNSVDSTIWRIPIGGGAEEQVPGVPKPFDPSHWVLVSQGIYVIDGDGDLYFYCFSNSSVTKVFHDARFIADWSMAISPDGREIVWTQIDVRTADVMLVENFH
jgi:Tol biopolymer transport system component